MTYHLLSFFIRLLSYIPFCVMYLISDLLYYFVYYVFRYRRNIVRKNLTESFPEKSEQELKRIEKDFYHFFTDNIIESLKMTTMSKEEMKHRMRFINIDSINSEVREGKYIGLYLGHYGNWEWISSIPLYFEDRNVVGAQIYHKLSNENMDRLILHNRERMGAVCVEMRKTARYVNEIVNSNKVCVVGFIADQAPRKKDSHYFIPFLNHIVPVLTGTEKIIKHYDFEPWFVNVKRVKRGFYEVEFVRMHDNPKLLPDFELTDIYYQMLEKMIMANPELYLWTHNRFRSAIKQES